MKRLVVVWLSRLSGRALVAQSRGVLGSLSATAGLFHFPHLNSFIYKAKLVHYFKYSDTFYIIRHNTIYSHMMSHDVMWCHMM